MFDHVLARRLDLSLSRRRRHGNDLLRAGFDRSIIVSNRNIVIRLGKRPAKTDLQLLAI
jgi:hypothetical protein